MINLDFGVLIDRRVNDVFAFVADPNNITQWNSAVARIQPLTPGAVGDGTKFKTTGEVLGRRIDGELQVTQYKPQDRCSFQMNSGPLQINISFTLNAVGTGTKLDLNVQGNPAGVFKLAEGVLSGQVKTMMETNLSRLKAVLEKG